MRCVVAFVVATVLAGAEIGDPAPPLPGLTPSPGSPAAPLVVMWWAPWAPPAREALAHVEALAARSRSAARFVVAVADDTEAPALSGAGIALAVAGEAAQRAWIDDAGVPCAVIVAADGAVAWRGAAGALDAPLARVLARRWDPAREREVAALRHALSQALASGSGLDDALARSAEILAKDPLDAETIDLRLALASRLGRAEVFRATLAAIPLDQLPPGQAAALARRRVLDPRPAQRHLDLALTFARRAWQAAPGDPEAASALAQVLHALGRTEAAVRLQAVAAATAPWDPSQAEWLAYLRDAVALRAALPSAVGDAVESMPAAHAASR